MFKTGKKICSKMSESPHKKITAPDPKGQESGTAILKYNFKNYEDYKALRSALCDFLNSAESRYQHYNKESGKHS